jgi:hypothetical protein
VASEVLADPNAELSGVLVTPAGRRLWRLRYKLGAIEKLISLGAYPNISLKRTGSNVMRAVDS